VLRGYGGRDWLVWGCFGVLVLVGVAVVRAARDPGNDPQAALALVKLVHSGEKVNRVVDYEFTRTKADGSSLVSQTIEMVTGDRVAVRTGSSLELTFPNVVYRCEQLNSGKSSCLSSQHRQTVPVSEVLAYAIGQGAYDVQRAPDRVVAGEPARCFRLKAHDSEHELPGLGEGGAFCLARDGVPLRIRVGRVGAVDERVAQRVDRAINDATTKRVLEGFEPDAVGPSG
jgi:hypothetical protein